MSIQTIVNWYKRLGFCGWLRFRTLWFAHRFIKSSGLAEEWDFVLKYLPYVHPFQMVLDVGTRYSLFIYEIYHRGYDTFGIDLKSYQEELPVSIIMFRKDIFKLSNIKFDFITIISVLQFIDDKEKLFAKLYSLLYAFGKVVLTVPINTMNYLEIKTKSQFYFDIMEYQECKGHIAISMIRKENK